MKKILGNAATEDNNMQTIYTVPTGATTLATTLTITNNSGNPTEEGDSFTIYIVPNGVNPYPGYEGLDQDYEKQYIMMFGQVGTKGTQIINLHKITLSEGDQVRLKAPTARISTQLFGEEFIEGVLMETLKEKIIAGTITESEKEKRLNLNGASMQSRVLNDGSDPIGVTGYNDDSNPIHVRNDNPDCVICPSCP